jgi:hypothetical protein
MTLLSTTDFTSEATNLSILRAAFITKPRKELQRFSTDSTEDMTGKGMAPINPDGHVQDFNFVLTTAPILKGDGFLAMAEGIGHG